MITIIEAMRRNSLTQAEVARKLGVTPSSVASWRNGTFVPSAINLQGMAKLFGMSSDEIEITASPKAKPKRSR